MAKVVIYVYLVGVLTFWATGLCSRGEVAEEIRLQEMEKTEKATGKRRERKREGGREGDKEREGGGGDPSHVQSSSEVYLPSFWGEACWFMFVADEAFSSPNKQHIYHHSTPSPHPPYHLHSPLPHPPPLLLHFLTCKVNTGNSELKLEKFVFFPFCPAVDL